MKRAMACLAAALSMMAGYARAGDALSIEQTWLTPNVSTLGVGIEGGYRWNEFWGARAGINGLSTRFTYHDSDSDLINRLTLLNAGLTADYYPYEGDFRMSAGVRLSANKIEGKLANLKRHAGNLTIIVPDPLTRYSVRQNAIQPYFGTGYSVKIRERISLTFDFGALYAGTPELSVRSRADQLGFTRRQINDEIQRQRDRMAPFKIYPVVQVGLTVKF